MSIPSTVPPPVPTSSKPPVRPDPAGDAGRLGPLCADVIALVDQLRTELAADAHDATAADEHGVIAQLAQLGQRLNSPLRVAVAGAVSAGKSTLVNALLGAPIAATGAGETTQLLTWYSGGDVERVELRLHDGSSRQCFLTEDGRLPDTLPVAVSEIASVHVTLPVAGLLRHVTVIDTPGLFSVRDENSRRTREALSAGPQSAPDVDALIFLLNGQQTEVDALDAFTADADLLRSSSGNILAVLSKVDQAGDDGDPLAFGRRKAARLLGVREIRARVSDILPVVGLIAETVRTDALRLADRDALVRLRDDPDRALLLLSADLLREQGDPTWRAERDRLITLMGMHGIEVALAAVQATTDITAIIERLARASGFGDIEQAVWRHFVPRADALKADRALAALQRLSYQLPDPGGRRLRSRIERLLLTRRAHVLRELWGLRLVATTDAVLPDWLVDEAMRLLAAADLPTRLGLAAGADPAAIRAAATHAASRFTAYANGPLVPADAAALADLLRTTCSNVATEMAA